MVSMRRLVLPLLAMATLVVATLAPGPAFAATPGDPSNGGSDAATTTTIDNDFLDTKRDITQCLGNSIDLPDCGVEPKTAGARGGWLQGVTFGLLTLGIGFISWRVVRAVKARDKALESQIS